MNLSSKVALTLVVTTFLAACSSGGLRDKGTDAGPDAPGTVGPETDASTDGHAGDAGDGPFNPCPELIEPAGGTIAAGAPCTSAQECLHAAGESPVCGASNAADVQAKVQTCHRLSRATAGAPCVASRTATGTLLAFSPEGNPLENWPAQAGLCDARDGLTCDFAAHKCEPFAVLGAACATRNCVSGTYCSAANVCTAPVAPGQACEVGGDVVGSSWCQGGFHCDLATKVCTANREPGAACGLGFECASGACKEGVCGAAAVCIP